VKRGAEAFPGKGQTGAISGAVEASLRWFERRYVYDRSGKNKELKIIG